MQELTRRDVVGRLTTFLSIFATQRSNDHAGQGGRSGPEMALAAPRSDFRRVYGDPRLRAEFRQFLENVYHLDPVAELHALISEASASGSTDREIYHAIRRGLPGIRPWMQPIHFALAALKAQKREVARQAVELLGTTGSYDGYVEIGTPGRYVLALRRRVALSGATYLIHSREPGFSAGDIIERGRFARIGRFIPLQDFLPITLNGVPEASVELVSCFVGLHHCPRDRLDAFVQSVSKALRPGGRLLLREHDVDSERMEVLVSLAHDVLNCGLGAPWEWNAQEPRFFKSVAELDGILARHGLRRRGPALAQSGDPTRNLMTMYERE